MGPDAAATFAKAFLDDTLSALQARGLPFWVALDAPAESSTLSWPGALHTVRQAKGDLGDRITAALSLVLTAHPTAVAIGTDSPGLPLGLVEQAEALLATPTGPDAVLGPSADGGFYLLGLRRMPPALLQDVRWSCEHTLADVARRLDQLQVRTAQLPPWFDVDEYGDLATLSAVLDADPSLHAPRSRRLLVDYAAAHRSDRRA